MSVSTTSTPFPRSPEGRIVAIPPDSSSESSTASSNRREKALDLSTVSPPGKPAPGQLTFAAPRRAKPARHLADLTMAERRAAVAELGEKPFRADQLSRHYFAKLNSDPSLMTDLPAAAREKLATALFPTL